jgi:hypothetical protein
MAKLHINIPALLRLFAANLKFYEHGQIVVCGSIVPDPLQTLELAR